MKRTIFDDQHQDFRSMFRNFLEREVVPEFPQVGGTGLCPARVLPQTRGTGGDGLRHPRRVRRHRTHQLQVHHHHDRRSRPRRGLPRKLRCHHRHRAAYLLMLADDEQKKRWLPGCAAGETVLAVAMTEPGTGSDLAAIRTTARRDGDHYILNGAKTFITNGSQSDLMVVVARTAPADSADRRRGLSLFVVDTTSDGFEVGRRLDKIGLKFSDTCEVSFRDVEVPASDLLGEEGAAFSYLGNNLPRERLAIAVGGCATARAAIEHALAYTRDRHVFGQPVAAFQNTKFVLAESAAELEAAQAMVDKAIELDDARELTAVDAAHCKLFCTEMAGRVIDKCLQLHGGYGYMLEYPIARLYADTRVSRIYGGTSEVMKTIIAKSLGL